MRLGLYKARSIFQQKHAYIAIHIQQFPNISDSNIFLGGIKSPQRLQQVFINWMPFPDTQPAVSKSWREIKAPTSTRN